MKKLYIGLFIIILSSCGKIPAPSILSPSPNMNLQKVNFGEPPSNYKKTLKDYLINNLNNYQKAKVEFINEPSKISINHMGSTYSGYRVCLSINEKKGEYYRGYKNHFFIISNNKINLHLFDSGLLTIPFEYCVSRDTSKELFIVDIPEENVITIDTMDKIDVETEKNKDLENIESIAKIEKNTYGLNTYILCNINDVEYTYIFNEKNKKFSMVKGLEKTEYEVAYNEAYIVASTSAFEITINRVSGKVVQEFENKLLSGVCELLDKTKF